MLTRVQCPECQSTDVGIVNEEGKKPGDQAELECSDCGHIAIITKVPLNTVFRMPIKLHITARRSVNSHIHIEIENIEESEFDKVLDDVVGVLDDYGDVMTS